MDNKKNNKMLKKNLLLALIVIILAVAPLFIRKNAEFGGADDKAKKAISQIDTNYKPWFSSIWTPPSGEIASLLFSLQAALGAGFIGYYFGYAKGKKRFHKSEEI
ncbi:energy-coupling factor ABC transporter substrate-binding protein [Clostridium estertheticum]|uniref:energy-coupling factor ABC transporter substrate-binding protein n=1 Tax=Clostridium estertheticum TaxID=238834 RepID=UPI0013E940C3|nr:energy-coupling factor ABC transporter substrate-binding protein [Clostridium estertheticum]MBZ9687094.1 energy-coupling factor ABC transporter substrate-binding protein [Clostridium estertheticum]